MSAKEERLERRVRALERNYTLLVREVEAIVETFASRGGYGTMVTVLRARIERHREVLEGGR